MKQLRQQITNQGVAQFAGLETYSTFALPQIQTIAAGRFESNGSTVKALGLSVNRASLGVYDVTFTTARANANYIITAQIIEPDANRDDTKIHVKDESQTTTGFTLHVYEGDNGGSPDTSRDRDFYVSVQEIADEVEEYYLPIVMTDKFGRIKKVLNKISNKQPQTIDSEFTNFFSADFDGVDDYIQTNILQGQVINTTNQLSISLWFKADSLGSKMIFSTGQDAAQSNNNRFYLWTASDTVQLNWGSFAAKVGTVPDATTGNWNHIVGSIDGRSIKVYYNGVFAYYSTNESDFTLSHALRLGGHASGTTPYAFHGNIDEVATFDTALSASEVTAIYNSGTPTDLTANSGDYQSADNLTAYYRFENVNFPNADSEVGTATGVMTNMAEDDITEDTP